MGLLKIIQIRNSAKATVLTQDVDAIFSSDAGPPRHPLNPFVSPVAPAEFLP